MKYLLNTTEVYRVKTEEEALRMIEEAKDDSNFILSKYNVQYKERKQKGEIVDFYWKLSLTKQFADEKDPQTETEIEYTCGYAPEESAF